MTETVAHNVRKHNRNGQGQEVPSGKKQSTKMLCFPCRAPEMANTHRIQKNTRPKCVLFPYPDSNLVPHPVWGKRIHRPRGVTSSHDLMILITLGRSSHFLRYIQSQMHLSNKNEKQLHQVLKMCFAKG